VPLDQFHIELQELKRGDLLVSQYLQKAKALADELSAAGRPMSTAEFNAVIYRNIGYEYHPIITALNLRPTPVSFYELHGHLVAHEVLLKSSHEPIANFSVQPITTIAPLLPTSPSAISRPKPVSPCQFQNSASSSRGRITCQICGYRSHTALTCYRRFQRDAAPRPVARPSFPHVNMATAAQHTWFPGGKLSCPA
jgi:hypothetical protein